VDVNSSQSLPPPDRSLFFKVKLKNQYRSPPPYHSSNVSHTWAPMSPKTPESNQNLRTESFIQHLCNNHIIQLIQLYFYFVHPRIYVKWNIQKTHWYNKLPCLPTSNTQDFYINRLFPQFLPFYSREKDIIWICLYKCISYPTAIIKSYSQPVWCTRSISYEWMYIRMVRKFKYKEGREKKPFRLSWKAAYFTVHAV
jgi:hypothetical protein